MRRERLSVAGFLWPLALGLSAIAFLLALGTWQMQRKAWREGLSARISARVNQPPMPLAEALEQSGGTLEYLRVRVRGTFLHGAEQFLWEPDPRLGPGYDIVTPLRLGDGRFILVNRGYVTEAQKAPSARAQGQIAGEVEIVGLLREAPVRGTFDPDRDSRTGVWHWRDLDGMTRAALGAEAGKASRLFLDVDAAPANAVGWPRGGATRIVIPNRHLEYALTWYGLAGTLVAVLAVFLIGRWRASGRGPG